MRGVDDPAIVRVHRHARTPHRRGLARAAEWPLQAWLAAVWRIHGAERAVDAVVQDKGSRIESATGIDEAQLRGRLRRLASHGIPPWDGLAFSLFLDRRLDQWPFYVYDTERGWNRAVSATAGIDAAQQHRQLQDKRITTRLLESAGVPFVPTIAESPRRDSADPLSLVRSWLSDGPIHAKDACGARGEGAFEAWLEGSQISVRRYADGTAPPDMERFLRRVIAERDLVVQPRLESANAFLGIADPRDVVTVRVVTRIPEMLQANNGEPRVFSTVLEVPLPATNVGQEYYSLLVVDEHGVALGEVTPAWAVGHPPRPSEHPNREANEAAAAVANSLRGQRVPWAQEIQRFAAAAHQQVPDVFAVAWDVALTRNGPMFLEGNTGFGCVAPQVVGGGLLRS